MKFPIILISLISIFTISYSLPHFIYDGIESFHENLGFTNKISFTIYGSLTDEINMEKIKIQNYLIEDMGEFECSLLKNEKDDKKRTYKIVCSIIGNFERRGYILDEPKIYGFDFLDEKGETTWPEEPERKTFLIGEIGEKIEIDNEPLLLGDIKPYVNPINKIRKDVVDNALNNLPQRSSVNKEGMIESMKKAKASFSLTEGETAYMVYKWVTQNIAYDCYNYQYHKENIDYTEEGTYNKGKGVCDGYAKLFLLFAKSIGLEAYRVVGYSKGASYYQGKLPTQTDHAWNSVKIEGNYYLLDSTWGAGSCDGANFKAKYREDYFCTDPEIFIRAHLPAEKEWQLISPTITLQQFVDMLDISLDFYSQGFKTVSPDAVTFNANGMFNVKFTYDSKTQKTILSHLYLLKGNTYYEQSNSCWFEKESTSGVLTCYTNEKGTYKLTLFGGAADLNTFPHLFEYKITSTETALNPKGFPITYSIFGSSDLKIIEPLYNPLTRSSMIKFVLKATTFDNLYIANKKNNNNHFRELDKNSNGEFIGEDVYIFGDEVYISTLKGNTYSHIVQYKTIRNPNVAVDASYPDSFSAPKNVLYSPLIDTLQYNKIYFFEIKCDSVQKIAVIEGSNWTFLEKKGDKFSGNVKILGYANQVKISYESGNGYYSTMYRYKANS